MKKSLNQYLGYSLIIATLGLSGCAQVKKTFGLERTPPNEFQVTKNPPLTLPPEFHLRPPQLGQETMPHNATTSSADLLQRSDAYVESTAHLSAGEKALLARSGSADPSIRQDLAQRAAENKPSSDYLFPSLVTTKQKGEVLDPVTESKRLQTEEK